MRKQKAKSRGKLILGVTGSFNSGKTTVAGLFKLYGACIIDADKIAHDIIRPGSKVYKIIIRIFGQDILKKNKSIDRDRLADKVFTNKYLLNRLNKIMHPEVIRIIKRQIIGSKCDFLVLDAPLLIEAGLKDMVDKLIVVKSTRKKQIERAMRRTSLGKAQISNRIRQQMPFKDKVRLADFVIDNSGTISNTREQVKNIWRKVTIRSAALFLLAKQGRRGS